MNGLIVDARRRAVQRAARGGTALRPRNTLLHHLLAPTNSCLVSVSPRARCHRRPNVIWAMDFQFDTTADGRTLKMLNVIDEFTREALAIEVDRHIDADGVVDVLDRLALAHGAPHYVRFDNGPEL